MRIKHKLRVAYEYLLTLILNFLIEWHNTRLENKRRHWTAHRIDGGGIVPLGKINQEKAIEKVSKYGSIRFVDTEVAVIMFSDMH